jgi:hypothetical protein
MVNHHGPYFVTVEAPPKPKDQRVKAASLTALTVAGMYAFLWLCIKYPHLGDLLLGGWLVASVIGIIYLFWRKVLEKV